MRNSGSGHLARLAAILCGNPEFRAWLVARGYENATNVAAAAHVIRTICGISSRRELDSNQHAAELFHERIRKPWINR